MKLSQLFSHWAQIRRELLDTIDKFDDADLQFVPFEGAWPAGQVMLHIADAERGWFDYVVRRQVPEWPPDLLLADHPTVDAIKAVLVDVHLCTEAYLASLDLKDLDNVISRPWGRDLTLGWIIWHVLEHEIHHRGELSLMLGLLGREGLDV